VLAHSALPAADAARAVLPHGGATLVTLISLLTVLSLVNAVLLMTPRILYAIGREGFFTRRAAMVSEGGTPRVALALSSVTAAVLVLSGSFEQIVALAAVLFLLNYLSAYLAVFILRWREPDRARPYRAVGFPVTTAIVLVGSLLFLMGAVIDDPRSGIVAAVLVGLCGPLYWWLRRRR
jgi:APA family basic amino acid/polyamine antiporter